jgi:RNA 2',3'-cyclic 3'-phosphodiesterase
MMVRAFIAITPPATLQQTVTEVREACQRSNLPWRWVKAEHIHLTLKFFENVSTELVTAIAQAMERASRGQTAFPLRATSLGCFPHASRPRVLWIGLDDPSQALGPLYERLTSACLSLGFPAEERPFHPHLTLARIQNRELSNQLLPTLDRYQNRCFGEFLVTRIYLYKSQLNRGGPTYTILRYVTLQN